MAKTMIRDDRDRRNFLFFLSEAYPLRLEDALVGALAVPSSWDVVAEMITRARRQDACACAINNAFLYIHVPFCESLCAFCHCPRVVLRKRCEIDGYIKGLARQMALLAPAYKGMKTDLLCFGGGTPSILDVRELDAILDHVDKAFPSRCRKIFFEAHPASWTGSKLKRLGARGLYRLSIGVQSFDEKVLKSVGRHQTNRQALWCLRSALKARIPVVNADVIAGLPGQTVKGLVKDVRVIIDEGIRHVHLQPYVSLSWDKLCGPGESVGDFLKRRDALMKAGAAALVGAGFRCQGLGEYAYHEDKVSGKEGVRLYAGTAVAAFGPFAKGEFPGVVSYKAGALSPAADCPTVEACAQDQDYVMSRHVFLAAIGGLDERSFFDRFGISLDAHSGETLRYLQREGLVACEKGLWRFSGSWDFRRVRAYVALGRALFGEDLLMRLRERYHAQYDPGYDYENGSSCLGAYAQDWLTILYYQGRF